MFALVIQIVLFAHLVWLGLYITNRSERRSGLRSIGGGVSALAIAMALNTVAHHQSSAGDRFGEAWIILLPFVALFVDGLIESVEPIRSKVAGLGRRTAMYVGVYVALIVALILFRQAGPGGMPWQTFIVLGVASLIVGLLMVARAVREQGEALLPDMLRSYDYSFLISAVFGGQIVVAMATGPGATGTMLWLLHGVLAASIAMQVYLERVQGLLDRIAFVNVPWLRQERAELREVENLLPRVNMTDPLTMDGEEFARLTRRALGHYGDLTKLATSPLTSLPEVHRRLAQRGVEATTLERARELRVILAEAIERLRPHADELYGTTDEWRFYNALYYPYVIGMRPFSRRTVHNFDDPAHDEVLEWFRIYVPERTLYNWQNAAAGLVAGNLREQEAAAVNAAEPSPALAG